MALVVGAGLVLVNQLSSPRPDGHLFTNSTPTLDTVTVNAAQLASVGLTPTAFNTTSSGVALAGQTSSGGGATLSVTGQPDFTVFYTFGGGAT